MKIYIYQAKKQVTKKQRRIGMSQFEAGGCSYMPDIQIYARLALANILSKSFHAVTEIYEN